MVPYSKWFYTLFGFALAGAGYSALKPKFKINDMRGKLPRGSRQMSFRDPLGITDITVHHSAGGRLETLESIARFHIDRWGRGAEYTFAVWQGKIYQLNDIDKKTYHNGYNNTVALGVCVLGNYESGPLSAQDEKALRWIINHLKGLPSLRGVYRLVGHNEYPGASTACPGRFMPMEDLRRVTGLSPFGAAPNTLLAFNAVSYNPSRADN